MFRSGKPIDWSVRWSLVLLSIAAAWLIPFGEAVVVRAYITLLMLAIGAFQQYVAAKRSKEMVARIDAVSDTAHTADAKADAAIRGRTLAPDQKSAIAAKLDGVDLSGIRLSILHLSDATEARDLAGSIAQFLASQFHMTFNGPFEKTPGSWPNQPPPLIHGTRFIVRSSPPDAVEKFVEAFESAVPEIHRVGEGTFGNVRTDEQINIIVGHKT